MNQPQFLFSYGTLQDEKVQLETFGRKLKGYPDKLLNYELIQVKIEDAKVLKISGKSHHPIAIKSTGNQVAGVVFKITPAELALADQYEIPAYQRIQGIFHSSKPAWVFVQAS